MDTNRSRYRYAALKATCTRLAPSGDHCGQSRVGEKMPEITNPQAEEIFDLGSEGAPSGTRTPNPLVKSQLLCQLS